MKTKTFLLLCLFLGIGLTQLSAQNGKNGTGSISSFEEWPMDSEYGPYVIPVWNSKGEVVDYLSGAITYHHIVHFKNGVPVWEHYQYFGEVISANDQEVFAFRDIFKWDYSTGTGFGHINLRGNNGSHYILNYKFDPSIGLIFISANWPGNKT
jgi:hypothetical protein